MNVIRLVLGAGATFVAVTADSLSDHLYHTIESAYEHMGFSFIHILQRCAHYRPGSFKIDSTEKFSFLVHENGVPVEKTFSEKAFCRKHDPKDLMGAFDLAGDAKQHFGIFYRGLGRPCQEKLLREQVERTIKKPRSGILDSYRL